MLTTKEANIMEMLRKEAISVEPVRSAKVSAAIVIKNKVISIGNCKLKSHPRQKDFGKNELAVYLHAEIDAITKALQHIDIEDFRHASIFVCRVKRVNANKKEWILGNAKPCIGVNKSGCMNAILHFNFKKLIYSTDEQTYIKEHLR